MRYLAAYLLCQLGGREKPNAADIESVLDSVGIEHDSARISKLLGELNGKDIQKLITEGREKMSSVPVGGTAPSAPVTAAEKSAPTEAAKETVKEEKKESESEDDDMGFGLFD